MVKPRNRCAGRVQPSARAPPRPETVAEPDLLGPAGQDRHRLRLSLPDSDQPHPHTHTTPWACAGSRTSRSRPGHVPVTSSRAARAVIDPTACKRRR